MLIKKDPKFLWTDIENNKKADRIHKLMTSILDLAWLDLNTKQKDVDLNFKLYYGTVVVGRKLSVKFNWREMKKKTVT